MEWLTLAGGLILGGLFVFVWMKSKVQLAFEQGKNEAKNPELDQEYQRALQKLSVFEEKEKNLIELKASLEKKDEDLDRMREKTGELDRKCASLEVTLNEERKSSVEKLKLLENSKEQLVLQFKNLSAELLEEKSKKFTEMNRQNIDDILKPLNEKISKFEKKVDEVYEKESKDRVSLRTEIKQLYELNTSISEEAHNLTHALTSQSKTQGAWGEVILERILEKSGLVKDREYEVQKSLNNEEGRRFQPDVLIRLPEDKTLVVDSKVSLVDYLEYSESTDEDQKNKALKKHIQSMRTHISELSQKNYQSLYPIHTLDFVLMFVPVESAFSLAVQKDLQLFTDAFERNIVIVSPSTLLATLKTISSIWRNEYQNKNALEIAKKSGDLYDKFVAFVQDLQDVGKRIHQVQNSYDAAWNKLTSGKGNLVQRAENIKGLGAKANKKLPNQLIE